MCYEPGAQELLCFALEEAGKLKPNRLVRSGRALTRHFGSAGQLKFALHCNLIVAVRNR